MSPEIFGWIGQLMLLVCSLPQAYMCWKNGHSTGLSRIMVWLWGGGMFFSFFYFWWKHETPAILNYGFNLFVWSIIAWYLHFPRKPTSP